jgi:chromate transporter
VQTIIPGINASVLGVLAAAFLHPVCSTALHSALDLLVAAVALVLLTIGRVRPWMVVLAAVLASVLASI